MKYICLKNIETDVEHIVLFSRKINHNSMTIALEGIRNANWRDWSTEFQLPVSAGFVDSNFKCFGKSETLNLDSRPQDTEILKTQMEDF